MIQKYKIGIIDSGIGGLSTLNSIATLLNDFGDVEYLYFADTQYCPYGNKDRCIVLSRVKMIIEDMIQKGCSVVVVACNTATNIGLSAYRDCFNVAVVGTEPAVKPAFEHGNKNTLLLATNLTVVQPRFLNLVAKFYDSSIDGSVLQNSLTKQRLIIAPQTNLAHLIEKSKQAKVIKDNILSKRKYGKYQITDDTVKLELTQILSKYQDIDSVVLGCTHYCFCSQIIKDYFGKLGKSINIYDGNQGIANRVKYLLQDICNKN